MRASRCPAGDDRRIMVKLPLPPGCLPTLWNNDERFRRVLSGRVPGYYKTADAGYIDEDGYLFIMARTDDIINVAGHRLSTGAMEEVLAGHPDVAECAVIGVADSSRASCPWASGAQGRVDRPTEEIAKEVVKLVRDADRSGGGLQDRHGGRAAAQDPLRQDPARHHAEDRRRRGYKMPATIDDPAILSSPPKRQPTSYLRMLLSNSCPNS
jgi:propionyl-CoA synthetase